MNVIKEKYYSSDLGLCLNYVFSDCTMCFLVSGGSLVTVVEGD